MRIYLEKNQVPDVLLKAFPSYNGRKFAVDNSGSVSIQNTIWSGGSKSYYVMVRLVDGVVAPLNTSNTDSKQGDPFGWIPNIEGKSFDIPEGFVVVEHCLFQGKDMGLHFYCAPQTIAPLLPETSTISERDGKILACFRMLKSGEYRRRELDSLKYTNEDRDRLASLGFLKVRTDGATSITPKGRNSAGRII